MSIRVVLVVAVVVLALIASITALVMYALRSEDAARDACAARGGVHIGVYKSRDLCLDPAVLR